ncbi:hypothetical protein ACFCV3_39625 [Kribbella sp. NPDC056345]|uniref:hypothetical protein n=1 Tax=Kribbella sp. NPDC056345 TaxID=3345789 RepID=UPI0035E1955B
MRLDSLCAYLATGKASDSQLQDVVVLLSQFGWRDVFFDEVLAEPQLNLPFDRLLTH